MASEERIDLTKPRWSQASFEGRARHFFTVTNPLNLFATSEQLEAAQKLVKEYKLGTEPAGTSTDDVWQAKNLYDSAFHPDTGEKQLIIGRMSAQVPMNMTITGFMMTFYKTTPAVVFWQWINQSFNAAVNYTNRSGDAQISTQQLGTAYVSATSAALIAALGLNAAVKSLPPLIGRFVPFAAVAAGNCVNIPLMRQREIIHGVPVADENGVVVGESTKAARQAVAMTVVSRILMASPGMIFPPFIMNRLENKAWMRRMPWLASPIQIGLIGMVLTFATPMCCAIFPQTASMSVSSLEPELQEAIKSKSPGCKTVYFNKGL